MGVSNAEVYGNSRIVISACKQNPDKAVLHFHFKVFI